MRKPFAAVVSLQDRLSVVGSSDLLARVLPLHSPSAILPADWPLHRCTHRAVEWDLFYPRALYDGSQRRPIDLSATGPLGPSKGA